MKYIYIFYFGRKCRYATKRKTRDNANFVNAMILKLVNHTLLFFSFFCHKFVTLYQKHLHITNFSQVYHHCFKSVEMLYCLNFMNVLLNSFSELSKSFKIQM